MKLNKKKWFEKNIIEFDVSYTHAGTRFRLMKYERRGTCTSDYRDYGYTIITDAQATIIKFKMLADPCKQFFYARHLANKYDFIDLDVISIKDAL